VSTGSQYPHYSIKDAFKRN